MARNIKPTAYNTCNTLFWRFKALCFDNPVHNVNKLYRHLNDIIFNFLSIQFSIIYYYSVQVTLIT